MDEKELQELSSYEKLQKEKEDANMRYVAQLLHEIYYADELDDVLLDDMDDLDDIDLDDIDIEVPQELHEKMLALARELDRKDAQERRRKMAYTMMKRCAVFLLCFGIVGGAAVGQSDALKAKLTNLFLQDEGDHVVISPTDLSQLDEWDGYYFLENVPEGYELSYVEDRGASKHIGYSNGDKLLVLSQHSGNTVLHADNETTEYDQLAVRGQDGFFFEDEKNSMKCLYWMEGNTTLEVYVIEEPTITREKLLELAEPIVYIKK